MVELEDVQAAVFREDFPFPAKSLAEMKATREAVKKVLEKHALWFQGSEHEVWEMLGRIDDAIADLECEEFPEDLLLKSTGMGRARIQMKAVQPRPKSIARAADLQARRNPVRYPYYEDFGSCW